MKMHQTAKNVLLGMAAGVAVGGLTAMVAEQNKGQMKKTAVKSMKSVERTIHDLDRMIH